ncbi:PREDICTED: uncharacterized protein LOC109239086 [Nicotiana attenuata]|uniref:uncharacterized protein LOC109239086 n=1 Tax=Nicotiana attenuata TaxID=49451 RepID=UPI0009055BEE|nr:PREDICTED: uncharacterized protein LOC109239086 [Nicotiana attenuata]
MSNGDKSLMGLRRSTDEYIRVVNNFLDKAFKQASQGNEILCPCKKCANCNWHYRNVVEDHLVAYGFVQGYTKWIFNGEGFSRNNPHRSSDDEGDMHDDIDGLLHDTFRNVEGDFRQYEGVREEPSEDAKRFFKLVTRVIPRCIHGLSNVAFTDILDLLKEVFPFAQLPESFYKAKSMIKNLGLHYEKIHACPNDCMLYWNDNEKAKNCSVCGSSRWKNVIDLLTNASSKVPEKVLRYFPLKPRLKRIFMCSETAAAMRWHATERPNDGNLRHPVDGEAWKYFDSLHEDFARDPRNVRLGLSSDGFNPFRTMSISHSTWPVMLMNYNLSPWICMKPEYIILSRIIPGPSSPGKDIDVYLQPLIAELKELWEIGMETYDADSNEIFQMRAALLWTVSDFPALAMHSGWSTKGRWACPTCNHDTCSQSLKHSRKMCYLGHRAFLPPDHPSRRDKKSFHGKENHRTTPTPLSGIEAFEELREFNNMFGKGQKKTRRDSEGPWKKKSIFFNCHIGSKLRHNLDVMHIEKNICDSLLGTLLDIPEKTKDQVNSRYDLQEMGIRKELQPIKDNNGKVYLDKACFSMKTEEKKLFCSVLKNVKLPKECASNISRCVQVDEMKISVYKSHDAHFIVHYLLQVAIRKVLPKNVSLALIRLGNFFRAICGKVIRRRDLDTMQSEINKIECDLEKIFPPTFFDIMVHFPIHLVNEIKLGGPAHLLWMYPTERNMCKYKVFLRNRAHPEASIAEGFLAEECLNFCSRYLHDGVKTRFSRYQYEDDEGIETEGDNLSPIFPKIGHPIGTTTDSFASARDQNPIDGEVTYCGAIQDIIEIDYWGCFSVVLFRCDWFYNEIDGYGLTLVNFNRLCNTDDPFVLASQVHQVFYVEDPNEENIYYARTKILIDLYDLEEENCPNIGDTFWSELDDDIGSSNRLPDGDVVWSTEDVPGDVVDMPSCAQHSQDMETSEEEDDFDDTDWDWMLREDNIAVIEFVGIAEKDISHDSRMDKTKEKSEKLNIRSSWNTYIFGISQKEKYNISDIAKNWTPEAIQGAWRRYKSQLKKDHFEAYHNDETRMENKPENIPAYQFKELLKYWNSDNHQKMSATNIENRKKLKDPHTAGKKSFAIVRNDLVSALIYH